MLPARQKKKPPTFPYLHKTRAKQLKNSWIEDRKIRSKWKAQKRKQGLAGRASPPAEDTANHHSDETSADPDSDTPRENPNNSPAHKQSLRNLRKLAYGSHPSGSQKPGAPPRKNGPGHPADERSRKAAPRRETGQPNMKLRMNVLLEKIKRDLS